MRSPRRTQSYATTNRWLLSAGAFSVLLLAPLGEAGGDAAVLFKAKCAVCHGDNGDANTIAGRGLKLRDIRSREVQKRSDADLATIVHCGKGRMPGYEGQFTDEQITELVGFMRRLAVNKPR